MVRLQSRRNVKKPRFGPIQEAPVGSVWELRVSDVYNWLAVVIGEKNVKTGNYPLLMLDAGDTGTTQSGQRINAAVTTARNWRRFA